jgi:hypothetical protein
MATGVYYAHPDGYLRVGGTGELSSVWSGAPKLGLAERAALDAACISAGQITYVPSAATTGLLPGTGPLNLNPLGDGTTEVAATWGPSALSERMVWGQLKPSAAGASSIDNSWIAGPRPDIVAANPASTGYIRETSNLARVWAATNCVFNAWAWTMPELNPPGGAWDVEEFLFLMKQSIGIRAGRFQLSNCEITGVQDGFNIATTLTDAETDELITNPAHVRHCWVHAPLFYRGPLYPSQPEGTHSDDQQWSRVMYLTNEYNLLGGPNDDLSGYALTPSRETSDGWANAGLMVKQEAPGSALGYTKACTTRRNIFWAHGPGGAVEGNGYDINHAYNPTYPNAMGDCDWTDNLHVRRADGKYVIRSATYAGLHSGHTIIDMDPDGQGWTVAEAAPITSGG